MITKDIIETLYKMHRRPRGELIRPDLEAFINGLSGYHNFRIENGNLVLVDIDENSLFRNIIIDRICGIEEFDREIAIVLPNSILFFSTENNSISVNVRMPKLTLIDRVRIWLDALFCKTNENLVEIDSRIYKNRMSTL